MKLSAATTLALEQLPVLRWSDVATTLENRTDGLIDYITNLFKAVPLNIEGMFLSMGNGLWSAGANLLKQSSQNESAAIQQMGKAANKMVGGFYHGLTGDWMIPAILTVFVIAASIFAVFRGQGVAVLFKRMCAFAIGLAMFLSMGAIAAAHPDTPSTGTPWWTVNLTRNIVGNTGNMLERSLRAGLQTNGTTLAREKTDRQNNPNYADCRGYLYQLGNGYTNGSRNQQGSFDSLEATMNTMWEETGLRMWIRAQYGPGENGSNVFCHVLEQRAGASSREQSDTMRKAMQANDRNISRLDLPWENALAFHADLMIAPDEGKKSADDENPKIAASNIMLDRMTTMWDVCGYDGQKWTARRGWDWLDSVTGSERGLDGVNAGQLNAYCKAVITGNGHIPISNPSITNNSAKDDKGGTKDDGSGNEKVWDVKDISTTHDEHDKNMRKIVRKFDLSNSNTAWLNVATQEAVKNADGEGPKINEAIITMKQQHGDANLADVGGALVFAVAGLVNFLIWGVGFGVMRLLAVIMASIAAVGIWLGFIVWAVAPDKGRQTLKSSFLNMAGMCGISAILGVFAGIVCMIMNVLMTVFGIIDDNGNTAATVVIMGCASLLFPLLSVWVLRWMCVNVLKVGDPFSMGALGKLSKSVGHGFNAMGGMLAAGTAAAVAGGSMKGIAQAAVSGLKSGTIGSAMAHGSIIGHNSGNHATNISGKGGGRHSTSRQPTAADRSINPQERQAIAENRDIAPSLEKPDMSKEQRQLDDRISQLDKQTGLDAYNRLAGKYKDDPAGLAQAVQQQVDAAHETNEQQAARLQAEREQRADIKRMLKATDGKASRKTVDRYMRSAAVQEQIAAKAKQSLEDRAAHQQAVRQYENEAADYNRQKELSKTFRGRVKMTRERYQTLADDHGKAGTAAAWLATGVTTAAGETARFAKHHKAAATALALPAMTALGPLGLAGVGLAGAVGAGGVMNMAHRMMGGGYGKLSPRVRQADQNIRFQNRQAAGVATATERMAQQHRESQAAGKHTMARMMDRMDARLESGVGQVVTQPGPSVKSAAHRMGMAGLSEATRQAWDTPNLAGPVTVEPAPVSATPSRPVETPRHAAGQAMPTPPIQEAAPSTLPVETSDSPIPAPPAKDSHPQQSGTPIPADGPLPPVDGQTPRAGRA